MKFSVIEKIVNKKVEALQEKTGEKLSERVLGNYITKLEIETCDRFGVDYIDYCNFISSENEDNKDKRELC